MLVHQILTCSPVALAELEGHLKTHADIADVGVGGMPDEYSLELAFVALSPAARARVEADPAEGERIKDELVKV